MASSGQGLKIVQIEGEFRCRLPVDPMMDLLGGLAAPTFTHGIEPQLEGTQTPPSWGGVKCSVVLPLGIVFNGWAAGGAVSGDGVGHTVCMPSVVTKW